MQGGDSAQSLGALQERIQLIRRDTQGEGRAARFARPRVAALIEGFHPALKAPHQLLKGLKIRVKGGGFQGEASGADDFILGLRVVGILFRARFFVAACHFEIGGRAQGRLAAIARIAGSGAIDCGRVVIVIRFPVSQALLQKGASQDKDRCRRRRGPGPPALFSLPLFFHFFLL